MIPTGVVIICHGSRDERAVVELPETMRSIVSGLRSLLGNDLEIVWAALQFNQPTMEEAVAALAQGGVKRIVVMPYFLLPGNHITEDIPHLVDELRSKYPQIQFIMASPLGQGDDFLGFVAKRIEETIPELLTKGLASPASPNAIERESMEIIDSLLPADLPFSAGERTIVKRIVHAMGDPQIAEQVRFHPRALDAGLAAIRSGNPIFTDVRMVEAGISKKLTRSLGCPVYCALSNSQSNYKAKGGNTRSAEAFYSLGTGLNDAVVAIGNAPTALLALVELIDRGISPSLVVGMPVGFVSAEESKTELSKRNIPYITITGRRGGSPAAAATFNALLRLALEATH